MAPTTKEERLKQALYPLINSYDGLMACLCQDDETGRWEIWDETSLAEVLDSLRTAVNKAKVVTL